MWGLLFINNLTNMSIHYTPKEETINTLSHAAGIVLGLVVGIYFLSICIDAHAPWAVVGILLYMVGMLGSYTSSTVYHAIPERYKKAKETLRKWDHTAIYWHIAGSYSPIILIALRQQGYLGWGFFIFIWLCAIVGTCMSFTRLKEHSNLETICFVAMGLSILVAIKTLYDCVGLVVVLWIIGEGVSYITGAVFYSFKDRKYMHSVFHFFVLGGSVCHIIALWYILLAYIIR